MISAFSGFLVTLLRMFDFSRYKISGAVILLLFASYFALYEGLGADSMQLWDESSYALNAQEMLERGNPIEVYLNGKPDLYNSKPPLAIWCMATSIHFFGLNEIGVRFPAASFGLCAVLLLFIIGYKVTGDPWIALCAPLVLLSSTGFMGEHIARTGDTDAILAFWILAQCMCFFLFTEAADAQKQKIWLLLTALTLSFGCLTKGIAGLTALPGLLAWLIYKRKGVVMFRLPAFYIGIGLFIVLVPGYYVLRNMLTPGYLQAVWNFEIGGRITQQEYLNPEYRPFYYFYQSMIFDHRLMGWIYLLPAALFIIIRSPQGAVKDLGLFLVFALCGVSFSLGLSDTKLFWYDAPLYPLIAGVIGMSFALLLPRLGSFTVGIFFALFCLPYAFVLSNNMDTSNRSYFPEFLKMVRDSGHEKDSIYIIHAETVFPLDFYAKQDEMKGYYSKLVQPGDSLLTKGTLLITEKYARDADINRKFIVDTLSTYYGCSFYKIVGYK